MTTRRNQWQARRLAYFRGCVSLVAHLSRRENCSYDLGLLHNDAHTIWCSVCKQDADANSWTMNAVYRGYKIEQVSLHRRAMQPRIVQPLFFFNSSRGFSSWHHRNHYRNARRLLPYKHYANRIFSPQLKIVCA